MGKQIIPWELFTLALAVISLESESLQVSGTLVDILADRNNDVIWIVSIHSLISNSSRSLSKPMGLFQGRQL